MQKENGFPKPKRCNFFKAALEIFFSSSKNVHCERKYFWSNQIGIFAKYLKSEGFHLVFCELVSTLRTRLPVSPPQSTYGFIDLFDTASTYTTENGALARTRRAFQRLQIVPKPNLNYEERCRKSHEAGLNQKFEQTDDELLVPTALRI